MSTLENAPQPIDDALPATGTDAPPAAGSGEAARDVEQAPWTRRPLRQLLARRWISVAAAAATLTAAGTASAVWKITHREIPVTTPIRLPATLSGLPVLAEGSQYETPSWRLKTQTAAAGTAIDAKMYGQGGTARSIRLVAARTDLTGKLELIWAADSGHEVGAARCTHTTKLTASTQPKVRPTVLVCWRTSSTLSVYSVIIDPKATTPVADADGAAAVEAGWRAATEVD